MKSKSGFTVVELLVVIAIIGVLMGLLLPAIQAVRETSRQVKCQNNMKQIGLALHLYESNIGSFPMGTVFTNTAPFNRKGVTWIAALFPYMEKKHIYNLYDPNFYMNSPENKKFVTTVIPDLICPSDSERDSGLVTNRYNASHTNPPVAMGLWYPGSMGPTHMDAMPFCSEPKPSYCNQGNSFGSLSPEDNSVGAFGRYPKGKKTSSFRDGLSKTLAVGETLPQHCNYLCAHCLNFPLTGTSIPINLFERMDKGSTYYRACGMKSYHANGINVTMADGSVHFIDEAIDYKTINELGTRNGKETIQDWE